MTSCILSSTKKNQDGQLLQHEATDFSNNLECTTRHQWAITTFQIIPKYKLGFQSHWSFNTHPPRAPLPATTFWHRPNNYSVPIMRKKYLFILNAVRRKWTARPTQAVTFSVNLRKPTATSNTLHKPFPIASTVLHVPSQRWAIPKKVYHIKWDKEFKHDS